MWGLAASASRPASRSSTTSRRGSYTVPFGAAPIPCAVASTPPRGQIIIDGGSKPFPWDRLSNSAEVTFGHVVEAPAARFHKMNEEHGFVDVTHAGMEF